MTKFLPIFLVNLALIGTAQADFVVGTMNNSGTMQMDRINVKHCLNNTGTIKNDQNLTVTCETIEGDGLIQAPEITIVAEKFAFTGTIACEKECVIFTKTPQESCLFKRTGPGVIIFKELTSETSSTAPAPAPQETISSPAISQPATTTPTAPVCGTACKKQELTDEYKEIESLLSTYKSLKQYVKENSASLAICVGIVALSLGIPHYLKR